MSATVIVSYDGTPNDDDALTLGRVFGEAGARLALAYVRHSHEFDPRREELAQHDAERRLEQGSLLLGDEQVARHVVISASTGEGLASLAAREEAVLVVFGSDYRTSPGRVEPGGTAQHLLEGGPVAIAVAPAGLRTETAPAIRSIAVLEADGDAAARRTADSLAQRFGAEVLNGAGGSADLLVVGSQPTAPEGRIALSGRTRTELSSARSAVVVVPRAVPVLL